MESILDLSKEKRQLALARLGMAEEEFRAYVKSNEEDLEATHVGCAE